MKKIKPENLYLHIPVTRLLNGAESFLSYLCNGQIYINAEFIDNHSSEDINYINNAFDNKRLKRTVHGPFIDLNCGSTDCKIRSVTKKRFLKTIEIAASLKARSVTFHSHFEPIFYQKHFELWIENSKNVWREVIGKAEELGVKILIENSIENTTAAVLKLINEFAGVHACFDAAHYNVFYPGGWIEALEQYPEGVINEVHLSDNDGKSDLHNAIGDGNIDFDMFFKAIFKKTSEANFVIESHCEEDMKRSINFISRFM